MGAAHSQGGSSLPCGRSRARATIARQIRRTPRTRPGLACRAIARRSILRPRRPQTCITRACTTLCAVEERRRARAGRWRAHAREIQSHHMSPCTFGRLWTRTCAFRRSVTAPAIGRRGWANGWRSSRRGRECELNDHSVNRRRTRSAALPSVVATKSRNFAGRVDFGVLYMHAEPPEPTPEERRRRAILEHLQLLNPSARSRRRRACAAAALSARVRASFTPTQRPSPSERGVSTSILRIGGTLRTTAGFAAWRCDQRYSGCCAVGRAHHRARLVAMAFVHLAPPLEEEDDDSDDGEEDDSDSAAQMEVT